jgi:hypothetical protein
MPEGSGPSASAVLTVLLGQRTLFDKGQLHYRPQGQQTCGKLRDRHTDFGVLENSGTWTQPASSLTKECNPSQEKMFFCYIALK